MGGPPGWRKGSRPIYMTRRGADTMKNDFAYANSDFIEGGADYPGRWAAEARQFREVEAANGRARLNDPYGPGERIRRWTSSILPGGPLAWSCSSTAATGCEFGPVATGRIWRGAPPWAAGRWPCPSTRRHPRRACPRSRTQIARAVDHAAERVAGPVRLVGHSAGGHLVARMLCPDVGLWPDVVAAAGTGDADLAAGGSAPADRDDDERDAAA